jgi:hypothetical protein
MSDVFEESRRWLNPFSLKCNARRHVHADPARGVRVQASTCVCGEQTLAVERPGFLEEVNRVVGQVVAWDSALDFDDLEGHGRHVATVNDWPFDGATVQLELEEGTLVALIDDARVEAGLWWGRDEEETVRLVLRMIRAGLEASG